MLMCGEQCSLLRVTESLCQPPVPASFQLWGVRWGPGRSRQECEANVASENSLYKCCFLACGEPWKSSFLSCYLHLPWEKTSSKTERRAGSGLTGAVSEPWGRAKDVEQPGPPCPPPPSRPGRPGAAVGTRLPPAGSCRSAAGMVAAQGAGRTPGSVTGCGVRAKCSF